MKMKLKSLTLSGQLTIGFFFYFWLKFRYTIYLNDKKIIITVDDRGSREKIPKIWIYFFLSQKKKPFWVIQCHYKSEKIRKIGISVMHQAQFIILTKVAGGLSP